MNGIVGVGRRVLAYGLVTAGLAGAVLQVAPGVAMLGAGLVFMAFEYVAKRPGRSSVARRRYVR